MSDDLILLALSGIIGYIWYNKNKNGGTIINVPKQEEKKVVIPKVEEKSLIMTNAGTVEEEPKQVDDVLKKIVNK